MICALQQLPGSLRGLAPAAAAMNGMGLAMMDDDDEDDEEDDEDDDDEDDEDGGPLRPIF